MLSRAAAAGQSLAAVAISNIELNSGARLAGNGAAPLLQ
jgi:hypothetical protein